MQTELNQTNRQLSNHSRLYAVLSVASLVISWGIFSQFLFSGHASIGSFFKQAFDTSIATLLSSDILLTALIFLAFAHVELKRLGMPNHRLALYALATFSVGICCGFALFCYQRERWLSDAQHGL